MTGANGKPGRGGSNGEPGENGELGDPGPAGPSGNDGKPGGRGFPGRKVRCRQRRCVFYSIPTNSVIIFPKGTPWVSWFRWTPW